MDIKHFQEENYSKIDYKVNVFWINIFGFVVLAVAVLLFGIPFYLIWPEEIQNFINTTKSNITLDLQKLFLLKKWKKHTILIKIHII